jgi:hypothetical protein
MQVQEPPYSDKVYKALKAKVSGFNLTPEQFNERLNDTEYQKNVYNALKSKVEGFNVEETDFYDRVKKKESTQQSPLVGPPEQGIGSPDSFPSSELLSTGQPNATSDLMANGLTEEQDKQRALQELNPEQQPPNKMEAIQTALESVSPGAASLFDLGRKAIAVVKDQIPASYYGQKAIEKKTDYLDELRRTDPTNYEVQNEFASDETRKKYAERQAIKLLGKEKYEKNKADYAKSSIEEKQALLDEVKTQRQEEADFTKGIPQTWGEAKEKGKIASYISGAIGNGLGQMPSSLATLGGSSYFMEKTDAYEQALDAIAKENGITPEEVVAKNMDEPAKEVAHTIGLVNGGIDLASTIFTVGKSFGAGIKSIVKKNAQEQILKNLPEKVVKESLLKQGVKSAAAPLVEYGTEFTQGFNTQVAALTAAGKDMSEINFEDISKGGDIDYESAHEEGLQGMIASGGIVAGGKAISKINEKQKPNEKPSEPIAATKPTTKDGGTTETVESPKYGGAVPEVAKEEVVPREVKPSAEKIKGQEKVDKALENLSKKIKPQENAIPEQSADEVPLREAPRGSQEVVEGVSKPKLEETPAPQKEKQVGDVAKEEVTFIKQELDGRVLYEDIDGNKYEAKPRVGRKNYDIFKNGEELQYGAKNFADIPDAIKLDRAANESVKTVDITDSDKTDYSKTSTEDLKKLHEKTSDFNQMAAIKKELDSRKIKSQNPSAIEGEQQTTQNHGQERNGQGRQEGLLTPQKSEAVKEPQTYRSPQEIEKIASVRVPREMRGKTVKVRSIKNGQEQVVEMNADEALADFRNRSGIKKAKNGKSPMEELIDCLGGKK